MQTIYKTTVASFVKRLRYFYQPYFLLYAALSCLPLFNIHGYLPIMLLWWTITGILALYMLRSAYKWNLKKITRISAFENQVEIELMVKDKSTVISIPAKQLVVTTKRVCRRPNVIRLTLFNQDTKMADVYGPGWKETDEINTIKHYLDKFLS